MQNTAYRKQLNLKFYRHSFALSVCIKHLRGFRNIKNVERVKFEGDWDKLWTKRFLQTIPNKVSRKQQKKVKQNWTRRSNFDISLVVIFDCRCQNLFGGRHWVPGFIQKQFWDFYHNIFYFPMILGLKLFGGSWGNFYTKILH